MIQTWIINFSMIGAKLGKEWNFTHCVNFYKFLETKKGDLAGAPTARWCSRVQSSWTRAAREKVWVLLYALSHLL